MTKDYQYLYKKEVTGYEELTVDELFLVLITNFKDMDIVIELKKRYKNKNSSDIHDKDYEKCVSFESDAGVCLRDGDYCDMCTKELMKDKQCPFLEMKQP